MGSSASLKLSCISVFQPSKRRTAPQLSKEFEREVCKTNRDALSRHPESVDTVTMDALTVMIPLRNAPPPPPRLHFCPPPGPQLFCLRTPKRRLEERMTERRGGMQAIGTRIELETAASSSAIIPDITSQALMCILFYFQMLSNGAYVVVLLQFAFRVLKYVRHHQ